MNIKAKVYCNGAIYDTDEIDISPLTVADVKDYCIQENDTDYLNIFQDQHIVPDVWRYTIKIVNGDIKMLPASKHFNDYIATEFIGAGAKSILLILESPHKSEYYHDKKNYILMPKTPASGDTGANIENHLNYVLQEIDALNKFLDGNYSLIISNPIPYMCSLGIFTKQLESKVRDNTWKEMWKIDAIKEDFIKRYKLYNPQYIINCCTSDLQDYVTELLIDNGFKNLCVAHHPVKWFENKYNISMVRKIYEYTAFIRKEDKYWIGYIKGIVGVNCQEINYKNLILNIKNNLKEHPRIKKYKHKSWTLSDGTILYCYLIRHLKNNSHILIKDDKKYTWWKNNNKSRSGRYTAIPRCHSISKTLARKICDDLNIDAIS